MAIAESGLLEKKAYEVKLLENWIFKKFTKKNAEDTSFCEDTLLAAWTLNKPSTSIEPTQLVDSTAIPPNGVATKHKLVDISNDPPPSDSSVSYEDSTLVSQDGPLLESLATC